MAVHHDLSIHIGGERGTALRVASVDLDEGLSSRTRAIARFVVDLDDPARSDAAWPRSWLGKQAELVLRGPVEGITTERRMQLLVAAVGLAELDGENEIFRVELVDPMAPLEHGLGTRKFPNARTEEIVVRVLGDHGIPTRLELASATPSRPWVMQYRESPLAFVERLLERDGIYYRHDEDGTVVLGDTSPAADFARGGVPIMQSDGGGAAARDDAAIHRARRGHRVTTGRVNYIDRDWKAPETLLRGLVQGSRDQALEHYVYGGHGRDEATVRTLAQRRLEALRAEADHARLSGNLHDLPPGVRFRPAPALGEALGASEWLVVRARHRFVAPSRDAEGVEVPGTYDVEIDAIPGDVPFRPLPRAAVPRIGGHHTGFVRGPAGEEIHTDEHGRLRVQMHWDREAKGDDSDSRWIRLAQETSSSMVIARTGWEVYVGYLGGDPERPVGLGRAIGGKAPPAYDQPSSKTRMTIRTPSSPSTGGYNEIGMEDKAGGQLFHVRAERDVDAVTKNDASEKIGRDQTITVEKARKQEVQGDLKVEISGNDTTRVEKKSEHQVGKNLSETIARSESIDIGKAKAVTVKGKDSETVGIARISIVGSIKKPDFKAMAKSALEGLIPAPIKKIQAAAKKGVPDLLKELFQKPAEAAYKAATDNDPDTSPFGAASNAIKQGLYDALTPPKEKGKDKGGEKAEGKPGEKPADKGAGQGGDAAGAGAGEGDGKTKTLPSVPDLHEIFTRDNLNATVRSQLQTSLSKGTGGLSDAFFKDKGKEDGKEKGKDKDTDADKNKALFGWDQADKLISMLTIGGIDRSAEKSIRRLVGGAMVEAALGPISWNSKYVWLETIGALKLTRATMKMKQIVTGAMRVNVGGLVTRKAGVALLETIGATKVTVAGATTLHAKDDFGWKGTLGLSLDAGDKIDLLAGGGATKGTISKDAIVLSGKKLSIKAGENVQLSGSKLEVAGG